MKIRGLHKHTCPDGSQKWRVQFAATKYSEKFNGGTYDTYEEALKVAEAHNRKIKIDRKLVDANTALDLKYNYDDTFTIRQIDAQGPISSLVDDVIHHYLKTNPALFSTLTGALYER